MTGRLRIWWPVFAWCVVILVLTTLTWPVSGRPYSPADKVAHFALYAVLGWLIGSALRRAGRMRLRTLLAAAVAVALFGMIDEVHQIWVPTRVPAVGDWLADVVGGAVGLFATTRGGWRGKRSADRGAGSEP